MGGMRKAFVEKIGEGRLMRLSSSTEVPFSLITSQFSCRPPSEAVCQIMQWGLRTQTQILLRLEKVG
jgi:hypothetical protein